jgi:hypothetical protein
MDSHRTDVLSPGRRRVTRLGLVAGITTFLVLVGSGVSYAAWTVGASVTSTASAATLAITAAGFDSTAFAFQNHLMTTTGSVTVTNTTDTTSATPGTVELAFGYTGSATLASGLSVAVWPTADTSGCGGVGTPPSGTVSGRWDTVATTAAPITGTLAAGASQGYCVRVTAAERGALADPSGSLTIEPSVTATLKVGNWLQSATSSTTQATAWIFPAYGPSPYTWYQIRNLATGNCVDVYTASGTSGAGVIDYPCKTSSTSGDYNQHWKFTQAGGDYYDITPRHAPTVRMDITGGSTAVLAPVDVQTDASPRLSQDWQLQQRGVGVYQIVNRQSGLCLQVNDTAVHDPEVEYAQAVCDGTLAGQGYSLTQVDLDIPSISLGCASAPGGSVTLTWSGAAIDTYNFLETPTSGGAEGAVGDAAAGATAITVAPTAITGADGEYNVHAQWAGNEISGSGIDVWRSSGALSCAAPVPVTMECQETGESTERTVSFTFSSTPPQYRLQVTTSGSTWQDMNNSTYYTGASAAISGNPPFNLGNGTYSVRAITSAGVVVATSSLRVRTGGSGGPYHYLVCR